MHHPEQASADPDGMVCYLQVYDMYYDNHNLIHIHHVCCNLWKFGVNEGDIH